MSLFSRKPCSACAAKDAEIAFLRQFVGGVPAPPGVITYGQTGPLKNLPSVVTATNAPATPDNVLKFPGMNEVFGRNTTTWEDAPVFGQTNGSGPVGEDRAE